MSFLSMRRRWMILFGATLPMGSGLAATDKAPLRKLKLTFPADAGAHTDFATEWWYVTGYANLAGQEAAYGFQLTFFRSRIGQTQNMQSKLAARQLLFAHAAITDINGKRLWHDQRLARWSGAPPSAQSLDVAWAGTQDTHIELRDWSLKREGKDLQARLDASNFAINLKFVQSQSVILQGDEGLSRKGPSPSQASYYYSLPQLHTSGTLTLNGKSIALGAGSTAWLDHEWSNEILDAASVGWDWIGINLFDGSALTAFQLRDKSGTAVWDGGSFRAKEKLFTFHQGEVTFKPMRSWRSVLTKANYPVEWMVRTPADFYTVRAVIDNQELDSTNSTGAVYWEGLCDVWDSNNRKVGRGYLEMTGYASPLKL
jgi:predicted secreted hydrolase